MRHSILGIGEQAMKVPPPHPPPPVRAHAPRARPAAALATPLSVSLAMVGSLMVSTALQAQSTPEPMSDPNALCLSSAQEIGALAPPYALDGDLEGDPVEARVDFYRFEAEPGTALDVRLLGAPSGAGTLPDPFLGLFDAQCRLLVLNDDSGSLESFLRFVVPADGTFHLAAAKYPDSEFDGGSGPGNAGSYRLTIDAAPALIDSISARVVNAVTGDPVPGDREPFAFVELYRCDERDCVDYVGAFNANGAGQVSFDNDQFGNRLTVGTYLLRVRANDFGANESGRFRVGENEAFEVWDIAIRPPPIAIGELAACENVPPQGGACRYEIDVDNNTTAPLDALVWSLVDGFNLGGFGSTRFEASVAGSGDEGVRRGSVRVPALSSSTVAFSFEVPSFAPEGAQFCQSVYLGLEPSPLFNPVARSDLFCIEKDGNAFRAFAGAAAAKAGIAREERSIEHRRLGQGAGSGE